MSGVLSIGIVMTRLLGEHANVLGTCTLNSAGLTPGNDIGGKARSDVVDGHHMLAANELNWREAA